MILLTLSRGKGEETVRLQLPASPAEIGEAFASLDRISLDTTATAILDVSSNVPVLYRCLYDVDVEDSEQFQKLTKTGGTHRGTFSGESRHLFRGIGCGVCLELGGGPYCGGQAG